MLRVLERHTVHIEGVSHVVMLFVGIEIVVWLSE